MIFFSDKGLIIIPLKKQMPLENIVQEASNGSFILQFLEIIPNYNTPPFSSFRSWGSPFPEPDPEPDLSLNSPV